MKIRLTKSELEQIVTEAVSMDMQMTDMIKWLANRPKCKQYLNKEALPDSILAIFFGDQLFGSGVNKKPSQGFLKNAISNDTIASKMQSPGAVQRATKIKPGDAQTLRDWLGFAIDYAFGPMAEPFCMMIAAAVKYATGLMAAFGVDNTLRDGPSGPGTAAVAGGAAAAGAIAADKVKIAILPEVSSMYSKLSQTEYFGKLNRGRIKGVTPMDFFFFPFSMGALSSGDPTQLSDVVLEADLKALKEKIKNVKHVGTFKNFFQEFTDSAFYNPVTKSSKGAESICAVEIKAISQKLAQEGVESQYEILSDAIKKDFAEKARTHIARFQQMLSRVPDGPKLLQLFSKYSLL